MIAIRDLSISYAGRQVAHVPELDIAVGELHAIVGESGSGKSQTAQALIGLSTARGAEITGSITLDGEELTGRSERGWRAIRGRRIAMVMQNPQAALNPTLRLGAMFDRTLRLHGTPRAHRRERMETAMAGVFLPVAMLDRYPHQISGGQAQRFAIALVSAIGADIVIADEPTSALDVTVQAGVIQVLRDLRDQHGTGVVFISHDLAVVGAVADRITVMRSGRVVDSGPAARVLHQPDDYTRALLDAVPTIRRRKSS